MKISLSGRELAAVLAGLRLYQKALEDAGADFADDAALALPEGILDIATCDGEFEALDAEAIDILCERLNCE